MSTLYKGRVRFLVALGILLAIDVALIGYLIWPGSSPAALKQEEAQLREEIRTKRLQVTPLIGIEEKLVQTRENIKKFYADKIPTRWSQISNELNKLAQANGVALGGVQYKTDDTPLPNIRQIGIDTGIAGDYLKIAHFINAVERDKFLFVINQVALRAEQGGTVSLHISFETFLQEG